MLGVYIHALICCDAFLLGKRKAVHVASRQHRPGLKMQALHGHLRQYAASELYPVCVLLLIVFSMARPERRGCQWSMLGS